MQRLTIYTYYNDKPVTVKVLYEMTKDNFFNEDFVKFEIVDARYNDKETLDIEELTEDEEFMNELTYEVERLVEQEDEEE